MPDPSQRSPRHHRNAGALTAEVTLLPQQMPSLAVSVEPAGEGSRVVLHSVLDGGGVGRDELHLPPSGRKAALRLAVGSPSGRSTVWRVFFGKGDKSDVYVASRHSAQEVKLSFHESGQWHFARTAETMGKEPQRSFMSRDEEPFTGRRLTYGSFPTWRPCPLLRIVIPASDLIRDFGGCDLSGVTWLPACPDGHMRAVDLILLEDSGEAVKMIPDPVDIVVGGYRLPNGRTLLVTSHVQRLTVHQLEELQRHRNTSARLAAEQGIELPDELGVRSILVSDRRHSSVRLLDLSVTERGRAAGALAIAMFQPER